MHQIISLREANQRLSQYIQKLRSGAEVIITSTGKPVARLMPIQRRGKLTLEQQMAFARSKQRLHKGYSLGRGKFSRDTRHER